jgi:hypothetical protein
VLKGDARRSVYESLELNRPGFVGGSNP